MRSVIAFICRTLLLTVYVVLGRYEHEATPLDVVERAVVTCMQTCILGVGWVLFEICAFVIRVLSRRAYAHVDAGLDDVDDASPDELPQQHIMNNKDNDVASTATTIPTTDALTDADADVNPTAPVTFASRIALGQYIAKVHVIGVVVWTTMICIDYALSQASFVFVLGMLLGNVAAVLSGSAAHPGMTFSVVAMYWSLTCTLVLLYLVRDGASALVETETELGMSQTRLEWSQLFMAVSVLLSPASCGFSWTFWMDARTLLAHYRTSLYTSIILSVPVLIFVRGAYLSDILSRYSAPWLTHVIITEPILKFMTIYTMTLSLDAEDVLEMLAVNTSVVGACYVAFEPHDPAFNAAVAVLITLLLALHGARLTIRAMRERRESRQPKFTIVDDSEPQTHVSSYLRRLARLQHVQPPQT
jgi:hypothetical protein